MPIVNCILPPIQAPQKQGVVSAINGRSVTNLVTNGNFANGTTGWNSIGGTIGLSNGVATVTGNGSSLAISLIYNTSIVGVPNNKIYIKSRVRNLAVSALSFNNRLTPSGGGHIAAGSVLVPIADNWYLVSGIAVTPVSAGTLTFRHTFAYVDAAAANGKAVEFDGNYGVLVIDLTTTFGAGNEPTTAQCDVMFANWFNGTTVI